MKVNGVYRRSVTAARDRSSIEVIDQRELPHAFVPVKLASLPDVVRAIREMWVRGAPLIGAVAAYGLCFAVHEDPSERGIQAACEALLSTRPTAVNLRWALDEMRRALLATPADGRFATAWIRAEAICDEDVAINKAIGGHGLRLLRELSSQKGRPQRIDVLTHCNAGWLATVDWGTALAPIYMAHDCGIQVHVWVSETRPRIQGALTAWELGQHGVPHTIVVDNAAGHLMQREMVDLCLVGADRVTARGDVCNKIGTYSKALAAKDNGVPFYVALPYPTIDWTIEDGPRSIPIEERDPTEVQTAHGALPDAPRSAGGFSSFGAVQTVRLYPELSAAANHSFDVTPARLITGLITERGIVTASSDGLLSLYPERRTVSSPGCAP